MLAVQSSSNLKGKMALYTHCVREICAFVQKVWCYYLYVYSFRRYFFPKQLINEKHHKQFAIRAKKSLMKQFKWSFTSFSDQMHIWRCVQIFFFFFYFLWMGEKLVVESVMNVCVSTQKVSAVSRSIRSKNRSVWIEPVNLAWIMVNTCSLSSSIEIQSHSWCW